MILGYSIWFYVLPCFHDLSVFLKYLFILQREGVSKQLKYKCSWTNSTLGFRHLPMLILIGILFIWVDSKNAFTSFISNVFVSFRIIYLWPQSLQAICVFTPLVGELEPVINCRILLLPGFPWVDEAVLWFIL